SIILSRKLQIICVAIPSQEVLFFFFFLFFLYAFLKILVRGPLTFDGWYPRDHKPGQYAVTEDERRAAAIKYGLRPEDYKPMNKDDVVRYAGDYPDLGVVTYDHKDPYEAWSDTLNRRNWGEMASSYGHDATSR
ncbi:unnamed protein product, partial [Strongylus vulgaris]